MLALIGVTLVFAGIVYLFLALLFDSDKKPKREELFPTTHNLVVRCKWCGDYNYHVDVLPCENRVCCDNCEKWTEIDELARN